MEEAVGAAVDAAIADEAEEPVVYIGEHLLQQALGRGAPYGVAAARQARRRRYPEDGANIALYRSLAESGD